MITIEIQYLGELRCEAVHQPSGARLNTDAPRDNMGKGESFSPTDLVATALGTCMATLMGIAARSLNVDLAGTRVTVQKEMVAAPMRRIGKLGVKITIPVKLTGEQKEKLQRAALTCPVHKSLHPDVQIPVEFVWA
ncbi:MAG: OsmC family protein [Limisphaerales bacterium]